MKWYSQPCIQHWGEQETVKKIAEVIGAPIAPILVGIGDDASVINLEQLQGSSLVVSTDTVVENRHFTTEWITPFDLGRRVIVQNSADIVAMGATIIGFTVAIAAPKTMSAYALIDIIRGAHQQAAIWDAQIMGGDLVSSDSISITVTALGTVSQPALLLSSARSGDVLAISGSIGGCAAGLAVLRDGRFIDRYAQYVSQFCVPKGPVDSTGYLLGPQVYAHALTDISDGLVHEARLIAHKSHVRIIIDPVNIPVEADLIQLAELLDTPVYQWILTGGEDHILLGTFAPTAVPEGWSVIGQVVSGEPDVIILGSDSADYPGWDSFSV